MYNGFEKYAVKTEDGFFSYESGHFVCNSTLTNGSRVRATTWTEGQVDEIMKALEYAREEGYDPEIVKVVLTWEEADVDFEPEIRKNALDKLTETEKKVLGV